MDQTALPVTAPNDPDPRWPEGYVAVLRDLKKQLTHFFMAHPLRTAGPKEEV